MRFAMTSRHWTRHLIGLILKLYLRASGLRIPQLKRRRQARLKRRQRMKPIIRYHTLLQTHLGIEQGFKADNSPRPISVCKAHSTENDGRTGKKSCSPEAAPVHASDEPCTLFCSTCGRFCLWCEATLAWFGWVCASCLEQILASEEMSTKPVILDK